MTRLDEFKSFVKKNPKLVTFVNSGEMTWQKFYEMFDLYGEENSIWDSYLKGKEIVENSSSFTLSDFFTLFKNIDLDSLQAGISNIQRVLSVLQDFGKKEDIVEESSYKPRPIYKHFED